MPKASKNTGLKRQMFRLNNLTGGMNTISEEHSYNTIDPQAKYGAGFTSVQFEWKNQENWEIINRGGISKDFGASLYFNSGVSSPITGIFRYKKSDGTSILVYSQGTKVYKLVAGVATDIGATIDSTSYPHFENANDYLIICDGVTAAPPQKWDGTTVSSLGGSPPNQCVISVFTQNRLFVFPKGSSYIYYSKPVGTGSGIEDSYNTQFIQCNINDGQNLTGMKPLFIPGELKPMIFASKQRSIGMVDGDGTTATPFVYKEVAKDLGVLGFRQLVYYEQDLAFLTPKGVSTYQTALKQVNFEEKFLSLKVRPNFTGLSQSTLVNALSWYDWKYDRIAFAVAEGSSSYPNVIWFYNIRTGGWRRKTGLTVTSAFVDDDGYVYTGSDAGKIYKHDPLVFSYDGNAISATARTPYLDFFAPDVYKRILYSEITLRGNGNYNLDISSMLDDGLHSGGTNTVGLSAGSYTWGGGVWTSDPNTYEWGGAPLKPKKFFPKGIFKNRSFTLSNTGANQPIDIVDWIFWVEYLDSY